MTAPQASGASPSSVATTNSLRLSTALPALAILLLVGLIIRLTLAYVIFPGSGFESDISSFTAWALHLADTGPGSFYATVGFADYPPGYLYVLWLIGGLGHLLAPFAGGDAVAATTALVKLPAIFADIAVGLVLYLVVRSWRSPRRDAERVALLAAAFYLFNPVTWYDSAIWGQTDAFGALVVLLTVAALVRGNSEGASALAVLAALIKPQFGIVLLPLVGIVLLRRHLFRPGTNPKHKVWAPAALRTWFETEQGAWRLVSAAGVSVLVLMLGILPFSLGPFEFLDQMTGTAGGYPWLTVNAYNLWALIGSGGQAPLAFGGGWSSDIVPLLGPIPGVLIGGTLLFIGYFVGGVLRGAWRDDRRSIVIVATFLALGFFMLPTRVHERYMFPIFGLLPLLAAVDRRWLAAGIALSIAAFINLHGVLTTDLYATPNIENLPLGDLFRQSIGILTSVALHIAGFAFIVWKLRPAAVDEPDPYAEPTDDEAAALEVTSPGATNEGAASDMPAATPWYVGAWASIAAFIGNASVRRDRSALLVVEGGGRLDRKDLLFIGLIFLSTLLLRTYRLEVPYSMYFDEVYHARTATEFLQDWEYDMPQDIYEYTHPHLAKYLMAFGILTLGNNRVTGTQELGTTVRAAAVEERWSPGEDPNMRNGDRLYVLTDTDVGVYDLASRAEVDRIPGVYVAAAMDQGTHTLYLATAAGAIDTVNTTFLDGGIPTDAEPLAAEPFAQLSGQSGELTDVVATSNEVVALTSGGNVVGFDILTGQETGQLIYPDPVAAVGVSARGTVVVDPAEVTDPAALAETLWTLLDNDQSVMQAAIEDATEPIPVSGFISKKAREDLQKLIDDGSVPGVTIQDGTGLAVALSTGVVLVDTDSWRELRFFGSNSPLTDMVLVESGPDQPTLYATEGNEVMTVVLPNDDGARTGTTIEMPNAVESVVWNSATTHVHVLGTSQDGSSPTIYVIEPRSNSVFADALLTAEPAAVVMDAQPDYPASDRNDILALSAGGQVLTVDTGNNQFAYRFPGVLLGSLMAVLIYLMARFLFRRRTVAVIAALLVLADGMMFANARIAMNDTYVAFFIVAAFTLFVPVWLGRWRRPVAVAGALVGVGVLLGLAHASKWVGAYAIGGLGLLVLFRSALGRWLALMAMIALTAVLGYIAITPNPTIDNPQVNYFFLILMLVLTALLAAAITLRPMRMSRDEVRLAVVGPLLGGIAATAFGAYRLLNQQPDEVVSRAPLLIGVGLIAVGVAVAVAAWLGGRYGYGPWARGMHVDSAREPASPPPDRGWLRPGSGFLGLPWLLALGAITLIPLVVYTLSYIPWINLGNQWIAGIPADNHGQTFLDLQRSMYSYHNELRATHPASSPWWAWPLDLKPVWFEQNSYAGGTTAVIYDTGNLVIFWLAIPAVMWLAYMAWRRRSLPLTFIAISIAALWLPWARIDRAAFQYHIFTTLPFAFLALAYFLAELWHGPSKRTWMLARVAAAIAIIGPPLLWLLRLPLCGIAGTEEVNAGTEVCANLQRDLALTNIQMIGIALALGGLIAAAILFYTRAYQEGLEGNWRPLLLPLSFGVAVLGVAIAVVGAGISGDTVFSMSVQAELPALAALVLLLVPAYIVLRAADPRRFVMGTVVAALVFFVLFYPNIASLPLPGTLSQIHLGLLPAWNWGFQFAVNTDKPNTDPLNWFVIAILAAATVVLCAAAIYAARSWRAPRLEESPVSPVPEAG